MAKFLRLVAGGLMWVSVVCATDSDLRITGIQRFGTGVYLWIEHPVQFTNRLDVLSSDDLSSGQWVLQAVGLPAGETNQLFWTDATGDLLQVRFYRLGNHDLDSDLDGLSDANEQWVYHTNPELADGDGDGVPDGDEIRRNTNPSDPSSRAASVYVNSDVGSDANDGFSKKMEGGHGPKQSLGSAAQVVSSGDTIEVTGQAVLNEPGLHLDCQGVVLRPVGAICMRP